MTETAQIQQAITNSAATPNQEILAKAQEYFNMGLTVVPFILVWNEEKQQYDKKPDVPKWHQWETRPQTKQEFDALHIENYSMFGVLCGTPITVNGEKVYLAVVDRDIKSPKLPEETKRKSYQAIIQMRLTSHEKTRSGGDHLPYFSRKPVKGHKPPNTGMELLGEGNWCVMSPSEGYSVVNDNAIVTVDDVEVMFYEALDKAGLYQKSVKSNVVSASYFKSQTDPRPCMIEALKQQLTDGNGHLMRLAIAAENKRLGKSTEQIIELFKTQKDFNPEICKTQIESANPAMTATCQTIIEYGYCLPDCTWKNQQNNQNVNLSEQLQQIEGAEIKDYEKNIKFIEQEIGPLDWQYIIDEKHPFRASELASFIMNRTEYSIITDKEPPLIYLFVNRIGVYRKDGEQILRTMIDKALGKESTTHRINETITLLKYKTYAAITPSKKIAVLNGLLDIQTGHLEPFSKYEFITNKLNAEYKENAKSDAWENFINQVCPDDKALLQEWSGYLLIKGYPYHAIMWLYGPTGRNGKGTWARTMQAILGESNYSSVSIDEFDGKHRFAVFNLHDSLFNICSEPRTDRTLTIEMLQMLTGQDSVDAERKGIQERFKFKNGAKMTVMGNKFPNVDKPTDAFWERLKIIKFPFRFIGKDQIPDIEKAWLDDPEQRSGVLNWKIEGAKRLITNGFTATKTQQEAIIQFKRASDNIGAFIAECLEFNFESYIPKKETYDHYKEYCSIIGVQPETNIQFNEKLAQIAKVKDTSTRLGVGKVKTKIWKGIKLKPLPQIEGEGSDDDSEPKPEQKTLPNNEVGTIGNAGTTLSPYTLEKTTENQNNSIGITQKLVPIVPEVPSIESRVCGDCGRFHLPSCGYIGNNFQTLPADKWAGELRCWIPKQPETAEFLEEAPTIEA